MDGKGEMSKWNKRRKFGREKGNNCPIRPMQCDDNKGVQKRLD